MKRINQILRFQTIFIIAGLLALISACRSAEKEALKVTPAPISPVLETPALKPETPVLMTSPAPSPTPQPTPFSPLITPPVSLVPEVENPAPIVPSPSTPSPGEAKPITLRDKGEGRVTLEATPATRQYLETKKHPLEHIGFIVRLDTHGGDLMVYNLVAMSVLRDPKGREISAISWNSLSDDSHHRSGILIFPLKDKEGQLTIPDEGWVELVVRYIANIPERALRWTVPLIPGQ